MHGGCLLNSVLIFRKTEIFSVQIGKGSYDHAYSYSRLIRRDTGKDLGKVNVIHELGVSVQALMSCLWLL